MVRSHLTLATFVASILFVLVTPQIVHAAYITDVNDAADEVWVGGNKYLRDPFDFHLGINFSGIVQQGLISRENPQTAPSLAKELRYRRQEYRMNFNAEIGLYKDLSLDVQVPWILSRNYHYSFDANTNRLNSSIYNAAYSNNILPMEPPFDYGHGGLGDITVGFNWAPLNDERDPSVATWVLGFHYQIPSAKVYDPSAVVPDTAEKSTTGLNVGEGAHRMIFSLAMSKRLFLPKAIALSTKAKRRGYIDPYVYLYYSLPVASGWALEADATDKAAHKGVTSRFKPEHIAGFKAGMEIVPLEDVSIGRKIVIDLGTYGSYVSEGRGYTQMTDPLGEITYHENYLTAGFHLGFVIQAAEFIQFRAGLTLGHETAHFLTDESAGDDNDGDLHVTQNSDDWVSPYWDSRYDQSGGRFRVEEGVDFSYYAMLVLTF